jgi:hypothetical protein
VGGGVDTVGSGVLCIGGGVETVGGGVETVGGGVGPLGIVSVAVGKIVGALVGHTPEPQQTACI